PDRARQPARPARGPPRRPARGRDPALLRPRPIQADQRSPRSQRRRRDAPAFRDRAARVLPPGGRPLPLCGRRVPGGGARSGFRIRGRPDRDAAGPLAPWGDGRASHRVLRWRVRAARGRPARPGLEPGRRGHVRTQARAGPPRRRVITFSGVADARRGGFMAFRMHFMAAALLAAAVPAAADDLTIVSKVTRDGGEATTATSYLSADHARIVLPDGQEAILDLKTGQITVIDGRKREYFVVTRQDMDQMKAKMQQTMNSPEMQRA